MSGKTFGYQGGFDPVFRQVNPDMDQVSRRKATSMGDGLLREVEEFINRFCVTATNDNGDIAFDAAGSYTFEGDVTVAGGLAAGTNAWHVDSNGNMWWGSAGSYAAASNKISSLGSVDFTSGTFSGAVEASSIDVGTNAWHVDSNGNMWWGSSSTYLGASDRIGADGTITMSSIDGSYWQSLTNSVNSGFSFYPADSNYTNGYLLLVPGNVGLADEFYQLSLTSPYYTSNGADRAEVVVRGGRKDASVPSEVLLFASENNSSQSTIAVQGNGDIRIDGTDDVVLHGSDVYIENSVLRFGSTASAEFIGYDWTAAHFEFTGDINLNYNVLISSYTNSGNIDHLHHDDSTDTWHFCSDASYRAAGNSIVQGKQMYGVQSTFDPASNDQTGLKSIGTWGGGITMGEGATDRVIFYAPGGHDLLVRVGATSSGGGQNALYLREASTTGGGSAGDGTVAFNNEMGGFTATAAQLVTEYHYGQNMKRLGYLHCTLEAKSGIEDLAFSDEAFMALRPISFHPDKMYVDTSGDLVGRAGGHISVPDDDEAGSLEGLLPLKRAGFGLEHLWEDDETMLLSTDYAPDAQAISSVLVLKLQQAMTRISALETQLAALS